MAEAFEITQLVYHSLNEAPYVILQIDPNGRVVIHDDYLRKAMSEVGIAIPLPFQPDYGRTIVKLGEADFEKAFRQFYLPKASSSPYQRGTYTWRKV